MTIVRSHYGQHGDECFGCKLTTLAYQTGAPQTHIHKGDPWDGNPVKERIEDMQREGRRYAAFEVSNPDTKEG